MCACVPTRACVRTHTHTHTCYLRFLCCCGYLQWKNKASFLSIFTLFPKSQKSSLFLKIQVSTVTCLRGKCTTYFFRLNYSREVGNKSEFSVGTEDMASPRVWSYLGFIKGALAFLHVTETLSRWHHIIPHWGWDWRLMCAAINGGRWSELGWRSVEWIRVTWTSEFG